MTHPAKDSENLPELDRSARLELLYRVVSAVSHDFNNVLATASMYSELLLQDPAVEGTTAEDVQEILAATRRGAALTAFLAVVKDSRGVSLEPAPVAVQLGHLEKILGRLLPDGVGIEVAVPDEDVGVRIDRVRLQQVIFGLVWSVGESLAGTGGVVRVRVRRDERSVIIEIRGESEGESSGGVPSDGLPGRDDPVIAGIGQIAESFGGTLEVGAAARGGFRLGLPRVGEDARDGAPEGARGGRVVVVADAALERLLRGEGLQVSGAPTPDAVRELPAPPDALVGPASRAMFRVVERIRSEAGRTLVVLLGRSVDVELPPGLEGDSGVRLVRSPASGARIAEVIREGFSASA